MSAKRLESGPLGVSPAPPEGRASRDRGAALVIALLVMAMLLLLGTTFLTISSTETDIAFNGRDATQAFYVAATGLARIQRDLVAQFAVPYGVPYYAGAPCAQVDSTYEGLTLSYLITGEPSGVPGHQSGAGGSTYCPRPAGTPYYNIAGGTTGTTWQTVPYVSDAVGGTYTVQVRNATAPSNTSCPSCIEVLVTGRTGVTGATRQIQARLKVQKFVPAAHALWSDGGVWPFGSPKSMRFAGPVFLKGWSPSFPALQLGVGDPKDFILNEYDKSMDNSLQSAVPTPPDTLSAVLRAYQGPVQIGNSASSVGEKTVPVNAVFTNQGVSGSPGPANVYSNNGAGNSFDLPRPLTTFPDLSGPYTGPPLSGATPASHDAYLQSNALAIDGNLTIDQKTGNLSYGDCSNNCLTYQPGTDKTPPTLTVNGTVWVKGGDIVLGGYGDSRLDSILYQGSGSLYARKAGSLSGTMISETPSSMQQMGQGSGSLSGTIELTSDLMPAGGFPPEKAKGKGKGGAGLDKFPGDASLGLISAGWVTIGDSTTNKDSNLRIAATLFANYTSVNYSSYQIAGSAMSRYFYAAQNSSIYYVPALSGATPPGMPGAVPPKADTPYFVRILYWRDVTP